MRRSPKPVRKCHSCLLNLRDHCWLHENPHKQWRGRDCPSFGNPEEYARFAEWKKMPTIKTRKELRKGVFRAKKRPIRKLAKPTQKAQRS